MKQETGTLHPTMTLMDHVREIRTRFFIVAAAFLVGSIVSYVYIDQVIQVLLAPLDGRKLIYLNPAGGFSFIFLVSIYAGIALAVPLLIQQIYGFIKPILPSSMRKYSWRILTASLLLLLSGIAFGYLYAIPGALRFLYEFAGDYIQASLTADSYLSFVIAYTIGIGLVFQVPLFLLLVHWIKPFTPKGLLSTERWVIVLAFIAAAIITPTPDPLNQIIIALPIIAVYQLGVVTILLAIRKSKRQSSPVSRAHVKLHTPTQAPVPSVSLSETTTVTTGNKQIRYSNTTAQRPHRTQTTISVPSREEAGHLSAPLVRSNLSIDGISRRSIPTQN